MSEKWALQDVWSFDRDCLDTMPQPVLALILLFPCTEQYYKFRDEQFEKIKEKGQSLAPKLYYMKQVVPNACGTVALIHSVANNKEQINLGEGFLKQFLEDTADLDPIKRGEMLESADKIMSLHEQIAQGGQTEAPQPESPVNNHFVAFVQVDDSIYELDGRKEFPINHGPVSAQEAFLEKAAKICQDYIARQPDAVQFSVVALGPAMS